MNQKTVSFETYGCAVNKADTEYMAGLLKDSGYGIVDNGYIRVVNTCTVKTPTERKILKRLRELEEEKRRVVVSGCMPSAQPEITEEFRDFSFIGVNIRDIVEAVDETRRGLRFIRISGQGNILGLPKRRLNKLVEIIPIASGCAGDCSYCITRKARGSLQSRPMEDILERVENSLRAGVRELWITAQDTGAYGLDSGFSLPELLNEITKIKGTYRIRVGMMNPQHAIKMLDDLVECYRSGKIYGFLHLPVQSGDNGVLKAMNRRYRVDEFREVVERFREEVNDLSLSTDVILGFPGEDDKAFQNTVDLIEEVKPEVLNISRFWLRPGTRAEEMKQHPTRITKDRSRVISRIFREYALEKNRELIGWEGRVLVSEKGRYNSLVGRNQSYKPVILKTSRDVLGKFVNVRVDDATFYDLRGVLV
ncbi:MAG: hypothetical protein B6U72_04160 [Candidatus Altiarchaeales archaeon ex4484_2]|nr:MAG: hypothetical protein B6U72_04160 [Candidatus Altiarchaeales archaeon ex4484_2]